MRQRNDQCEHVTGDFDHLLAPRVGAVGLRAAQRASGRDPSRSVLAGYHPVWMMQPRAIKSFFGPVHHPHHVLCPANLQPIPSEQAYKILWNTSESFLYKVAEPAKGLESLLQGLRLLVSNRNERAGLCHRALTPNREPVVLRL